MGKAAADVVQSYKSVQDELRTDILKILKGGSVELELREVVRKIEAMGFTNYLGIWRWESKTRKWLSDHKEICSISPPFEIEGEKLFVFEAPRSTSFRKMCYWALYQSLKTGEFSRLRKCPHCAKILVPEDPKRKYCPTGCKDTYNNERRKREGYFTDLWRMKRKNALARARALLREGKPLRVIEKETGLTRRILEREKLVKA